MKKLIFLICLLVGVGISVMAADSGTTPSVGSTHTYTVTKGAAANTVTWGVYDATNATQITAAASYVSSTGTGAGEATSVFTVTFDPSWATAGTTYIIRMEETDAEHSCVAQRTTSVTPENNFAVTVAGESDACNDNTTVAMAQGASANTNVTFTLTRTDDFTPTSWGYTATITLSNTNYSLVSATPATGSNGGTAAAPDVSSLTGANTSDVLTVVINGPADEACNVTIASVSGTAVNAGGNVTDSGTGTKTATVIVYALPDTSNITAN